MPVFFSRLLCFVLILSACGKQEVLTSDSHESARTIKNGTAIATTVYPYVGAVLSDFGDLGQGTCTGTLLSPRLVLTAAHCAFTRSGSSVYRASQIYFTRVPDVRTTTLNSSNTTRVINVIAPYGFEQVFISLPALNDFVLLRLEAPIDLAAYPKVGSQGNLRAGQSLEIVGYGQNERGISGVRRSGTMNFSGWRQPSGTSGSVQTPYLNLASGAGNQSTCPGDSGGPAFLRNGDGTLSLVGISHIGPNTACANVSQVSHTAIDSYLEFIQDIVSGTGRSAFTNANNRYDVNDDGFVSALDALLIINELNRSSNPTSVVGGPFLDVNGDGSVAPNDVLWVINHMNVEPIGAYSFTSGSTLRFAAVSQSSYTSAEIDSASSYGNWNPAINKTQPLARNLDAGYAFYGWANSGDQRLIYGSNGRRFLLSRTGSLKRIVRSFAGRDVAVAVAELLPAFYQNPNLLVGAY